MELGQVRAAISSLERHTHSGQGHGTPTASQGHPGMSVTLPTDNDGHDALGVKDFHRSAAGE